MNPWKKLTAEQFLVVPGVWDGFTARLAEHHGFPAILSGGYLVGVTAGSAEPLLTATEALASSMRIKRATSVPLRVDCGAGFGDPIQIVRLVKDLKIIGVEGMTLEDQVFPKRFHYHRDYQEHLIPLRDMVEKIAWAKDTAGDDVYVVGRTDAFATHGLDEAVERCRAFIAAGADAVQVFPSTMDDAEQCAKLIDGDVWYANTRGNRVGRPTLTPEEAQSFGYVALADGWILFTSAFAGMRKAIAEYTSKDGFPAPDDEIGIRNDIEDALNFEEMYAIEEKTTERAS